MNNLTKAAKLLGVASTYAEDGAIITAIERAETAIKLLKREYRRRWGPIPPNHLMALEAQELRPR